MNAKMKIGGMFDNVDEDEHETYVIAEIGINQEGSVDRCGEMIRANAVTAGISIDIGDIQFETRVFTYIESVAFS